MSNTHAPQSSTSPPLPNLHSLAISPYPGASAAASGPNSAGAGPGAGPGAGGLHGGGGGGGGGGNQGSDYRYNGVFGPPVPGHTPGWSSPNKRGSRSGLPTNWFDPTARESPHPPFESYRHSPSTLSPPSSTTSGPNSAHAYPYPGTGYNTLEPGSAFNMTISPSPPPMIGEYSGIPSAGSAPNLTGYNSSGMPQYGTQSLASFTNRNGLSGLNGMWSRGAYGSGLADDDVIPTAIVIKNIPFAVPREQLLGVIESLGAPLPYAFNYHHDNGIFRGLAFANFRAPDEAASVVAALNGYDVQGRKLRVEYKKVLQPGEKDKIEREKALKRMRSIQFDSAVMKDIPPPLNMMPPPPHPHQQPPPQQHQQQHQHQASHHHSNSQSQSIAINRPSSQQHNGHGNPHLSESYGGVSEAESPPHSASSATSESQNLPMNLDLNDPMALDIYSRVLVFKEDRMRDELAFSKSLTPTERRIVHLVANKLGLMSITKGGEGEVKYVVVTREAAPARPALTSSNSANTGGGSYLSPYGTTQAEVSPSLRIKKSMPDLRGFNGPVVARDPARSLTPQRSSGNLRGDANGQSREYVSMGASSGRRANGLGSGNFNGYFGSPVDGAPPVPPLPTGLGLHASKSSSSVSGAGAGTSPDNLDGRDPGSAPMRNPRGPAGDARGFAIRSNGGGMLRSQQNGPGGFGRALNEEEEEGYDEGQQHQQQQQETHTPPQPQAQEPEGARTRGEVEV